MSFWRSHSSKSLLALSSTLPLLLIAPSALAQAYSISSPYSTLSFSDSGNHWAAGCIEGVGREGLIKGYLDGRFQPDSTMTRAEFAAVMVKAFPNAPVIRDEPIFSDGAPDFWGWSAIKAAYSRGFLAGYPGNLFKPAQTISRAQAMIVIANAQDNSTQQTAAAADAVVLSQYFQDAQAIPAYARPGIATATRSGLVVNYPTTNQLRPNDSITRGEATALLCRINEDDSDARYYIDTTYIAAFGDQFDPDGVPEASEPSELTLLETLDWGLHNSFFSRTLKVGNRLFFTDDSGEVTDLWQTDGTTTRTQLVRSLDSNGDRTVSTNGARFIGVSEERMWLLTYPYQGPDNAQRAALWSSNRAANNTQEAKDFSPALAAALSQAKDVQAGEYVTTALNECIPLFIRTEEATQLWMTDGKSSVGTQQLATFSPAFRDNFESPSQQFATTDDYVFFVAATQADTAFSESAALWRTDGTSEGTVPLQTIGKVDERDTIFAWKNQVYFTATTPEAGKEIWVSDGTERGTQLLQDIYPGPENSEVSIIGTTETDLFLLANSSEDRELWATTGTFDSTRLLKRLGYPDRDIEKGSIIHANDEERLFFNSSDELPAELWVTDGTELGTRPVLLGNPYANEAVAFKGRFFFSNRTIDGEELWVSNGVALETYQFADLTPGEIITEGHCAHPIPGVPDSGGCTSPAYVASSTAPIFLTVLGYDLYFVASGNRLFRTDGTVGGIELIETLNSSKGSIGNLVKLDERILFVTHGDLVKLWSIGTDQASP